MGDGDHGARVALEVMLQPRHAFGVEVVGGLVEQQHVGLFQQNLAQRHATLFTTRQLGHVGVARRQAQRVHGHFDLVVEVPQIVLVDVLLQLPLPLDQRIEVRIGLGELE